VGDINAYFSYLAKMPASHRPTGASAAEAQKTIGLKLGGMNFTWCGRVGPGGLGFDAGRVAIANSDAGGDAYAHLAIDHAERAVHELLKR
jgi:hypothetical protein